MGQDNKGKIEEIFNKKGWKVIGCNEIGKIKYRWRNTFKMETVLEYNVIDSNGKEITIFVTENGTYLAYEREGNLKYYDNISIEINDKALFENMINEKRYANASNGASQRNREEQAVLKKFKEEKTEEKKEEKDDNAENKKRIPILNDIIHFDSNYYKFHTVTPLNQIINGHTLYRLLKIDELYADKLPNEVKPEWFKNGYLIVVDSKILEEKDGNRRPFKYSFVMCTSFGGITVELKEPILEPIERTSRNRFIAEKAEINRADGDNVTKPKNELDSTEEALYKIPARKDNPEDCYLRIQKDRELKNRGVIKNPRHPLQISFGQVSRYDKDGKEIKDERKRMQNGSFIKLEGLGEPHLSKAEEAQQNSLEAFDRNEATKEREKHVQELFEKLILKCAENDINWENYSNEGYIKNKIRELLNCLDDNDIVRQLFSEFEGYDYDIDRYNMYPGSTRHPRG